MVEKNRDHGGGLDAAISAFGGTRDGWLDLSTGINPVGYPLGDVPLSDWTALPDLAAQSALEQAARQFWNVPDSAAICASPGASTLIAKAPSLAIGKTVYIQAPTYNEHAAAFEHAGWRITQEGAQADAQVVVHPNNPDGLLWDAHALTTPFTVIDESFCDVTPEHSLVHLAAEPNRLILKSFGKFWGLAGLRLGFAIGAPDLIAALKAALGPWPVAGPALRIGTQALNDHDWAQTTRQRLHTDAQRLDDLITAKGARLVGGTDLFRLYDVPSAKDWHDHLASQHILTRIFPYSDTLIRFGLPAPDQFERLAQAL